MKVIHEKASEVNEILENGISREIGEDSFVGLKRIQTPEDQIEWLKHAYAYRYAKRLAKDRFVLDIGCGSGYGAHMLSKKSAYVIGIDLWKERIREKGYHAPYKYHPLTVISSFIEKLFEEKARSIAIQLYTMSNPTFASDFMKEALKHMYRNKY
jgi:2-polyprenyl-3-methyl-5-hydroxy-6-metoxy-1,4-benzoquinol methylase